jgi:hypothetical protein
VFFPAKICQFDKTKNIGKKEKKQKEKKEKRTKKKRKALILAVKKTP